LQSNEELPLTLELGLEVGAGIELELSAFSEPLPQTRALLDWGMRPPKAEWSRSDPPKAASVQGEALTTFKGQNQF
jgi:hypothetical protein